MKMFWKEEKESFIFTLLPGNSMECVDPVAVGRLVLALKIILSFANAVSTMQNAHNAWLFWFASLWFCRALSSKLLSHGSSTVGTLSPSMFFCPSPFIGLPVFSLVNGSFYSFISVMLNLASTTKALCLCSFVSIMWDRERRLPSAGQMESSPGAANWHHEVWAGPFRIQNWGK